MVKVKFLTVLFCLFIRITAAQPLWTSSRWIIDESGQRVKLSCVNWPSHLDAVVAEGLRFHSVDEISQQIRDMGFNCVRLTWPLFLFTNDTLASLTVRESFTNLGLNEALEGIQAHNPSIIDLPLINAYQEVVASLARNNVLIILDNHTSKPGWCCSNTDGNGFFGDKYFDPKLWIQGLTKVATIFNDTKNVVAMSLRNELRGPRQNFFGWYRYMQKGAEAVHKANPNVLVILSGLSYDRDFRFLHFKRVKLTFSSKLVFELHWYGFSDGQAWENSNPNQVCGKAVRDIMRKGGFLLNQGYPLFISEFGVDMRGNNVNDNRYLDCFLGWAAEQDLDWALWALQGSYYIREGTIGMDEKYGVYNWDWSQIRNQTVLDKISALQYPFRGPGYEGRHQHKVLFHPSTGLCVKKTSWLEPLVLHPCSEAASWGYSPRQILTITGTYFCLQAQKMGEPAKLTILCNGAGTKWETISNSKMHLSTTLEDGTRVCLAADSKNTIITESCICLEKDSACDPGSQWFKIVDSTRSNKISILNEARGITRSNHHLQSFPQVQFKGMIFVTTPPYKL